MGTTSRVMNKAEKPGKPTSLGSDIDKMHDLREKKRKLEAEIKGLDAEYSGYEERLMAKMEQAGLDKMTGKKGTVSVTSAIVADVQDWDAFHAFIGKTKSWHMLQKRVSDPAWREYCEMTKKNPPGTVPFTKRRLNLRAVGEAA